MKWVPPFFRIHYLEILASLLIIALMFISISQYKTRETYKAYISEKLSADFQSMGNSIRDNNSLYRDILRTGMISRTQQNALMRNNEMIRDFILQYRGLAVALHLQGEGYMQDQTSINALNISRLFLEWNQSNAEELNTGTRLIVSKVQELNEMWDSEMREETYSLADSLWIQTVDGIEKDTLSFLEENKIKNIEELWLTRSEIK